MEGLGLGYSELAGINHGIIMTSITPFGQTGPNKNYQASDLVCWAAGGLLFQTGEPEYPPVHTNHIPLAYLFSIPFIFFDESFFLPSFIAGYWLTNLLGFLFMHLGGEGLIYQKKPAIGIRRSLLISLLYSIIVICFVILGWLAPPTEYLQHLGE